MIKITPKQMNILSVFLEKGPLRVSEVREEIIKTGREISKVTVSRTLSAMAREGILQVSGSGRSTIYDISALGRIFSEIDAKKYYAFEPDKRYGMSRYNFNLLPAMPSDIFTQSELKTLDDATSEYKRRSNNLPPAIQKKELERLVIELSWKSSKIEGNTYTLLDTEKLILENKEAPGHDKKEAQMILNHKNAFNFILKNASQFKTITRKNIQELHSVIVESLNVNLGFRQKPVGVLGSKYRPLDNMYQITEAVDTLSAAVSRMTTSYAKAIMAVLGISYIQPFEDGNKRTSRLMANALLLAHNCAPLSYRSIDENEYREAVLIFYELNSIIPFKRIFIDQYLFAALNYTLSAESTQIR